MLIKHDYLNTEKSHNAIGRKAINYEHVQIVWSSKILWLFNIIREIGLLIDENNLESFKIFAHDDGMLPPTLYNWYDYS
jgi:hypothetical protein